MIKLKVEKVDLYSNILEKEMSMLVYLPTTYNHLNSLPVLYFLHQRRGDENIMFEIDIHTTADKLIETGKIEPMIIVCPRMENSRGVNSSIVCKEIPDPVKSHRTIHLGRYVAKYHRDIRSRFVAGNSPAVFEFTRHGGKVGIFVVEHRVEADYVAERVSHKDI